MSSIGGAAVAGIPGGSAISEFIAGNAGIVQFQTEGGSTICKFDLQKQETYSQQTQPTMFPIESGATVSDHVMLSPFMIELECLITDTPLDDAAALITSGIATAASALVGPLGVVAGAGALALSNSLSESPMGEYSGEQPPTRSILAWATLYILQTQSITPFTVITKLGPFDNMVITNMSVPRNNETGDSLVFNISLQQMNIVKAQNVDPSTLGNAPLSSDESDLGEKTGDSSKSDPYSKGTVAFQKKTGFNPGEALD